MRLRGSGELAAMGAIGVRLSFEQGGGRGGVHRVHAGCRLCAAAPAVAARGGALHGPHARFRDCGQRRHLQHRRCGPAAPKPFQGRRTALQPGEQSQRTAGICFRACRGKSCGSGAAKQRSSKLSKRIVTLPSSSPAAVEPEELPAAQVSPGLLTTLGAVPATGTSLPSRGRACRFCARRHPQRQVLAIEAGWGSRGHRTSGHDQRCSAHHRRHSPGQFSLPDAARADVAAAGR